MKILESSRVTGSNETLELSPRLAEMKHNIREDSMKRCNFCGFAIPRSG
jgi:hypothetical protein